MADTISKLKQQELCDVLNTAHPLPGLTWFPDPSPILGGIVARRADGTPVWEARRDRGRVNVILPFTRRTTHFDRGAFVGCDNEFNGMGWVHRFAAALASYVMAQPVPL